MAEIPSNFGEYEQTPEALLTAAVDMRLSPLAEHQPIQVFEEPIKGIKRELQLVEGDALDRKYLYLKISSGIGPEAVEQYSVRAYNQNTWVSTIYTWIAGEPIKVIDCGDDRGLQEGEIEKLVQRIYTAPVYDPRLHKIDFRKRRRKDGTTDLIPVVGEHSKIGRMILDLINKFRRY